LALKAVTPFWAAGIVLKFFLYFLTFGPVCLLKAATPTDRPTPICGRRADKRGRGKGSCLRLCGCFWSCQLQDDAKATGSGAEPKFARRQW